MNREAILNKAHELANKAEPIKGVFPKSTLIAVGIDMAEFGYHQAEKDLALTYEDMRELYIIFAEVDVDIEFCKIDIKSETIGYYEEVLRRFNKRRHGK